MTDCGCDKAKAELEEFLHNELSAQDAADVAEHIDGCTDCSEEHVIGLLLTEKVKKACQEQAPSDLRDQVLSKLSALRS
jgi:anti-sigma factor (TIGR02949 family)